MQLHIQEQGGIGMSNLHSTTVLAVKKNGILAMGSDGQVTLGNTVIKHTAKKIRKLYNDKVLVGFAGASGDALALIERFEEKLDKYTGNLVRAGFELAKEWRMDKALRRLEAIIIAANLNNMFILSGQGDMIEPENNVAAIGSGGAYAQAAAQALLEETELEAPQIVEKALKIAGQICIYTNTNISIEILRQG